MSCFFKAIYLQRKDADRHLKYQMPTTSRQPPVPILHASVWVDRNKMKLNENTRNRHLILLILSENALINKSLSILVICHGNK